MSFFDSVLIGMSIAAVPGAVFFELVRRTLTKGFWSGVLFSVGVYIGNFTLLSLIFFGVSDLLTQEITRTILYLIGGLILIWLGVSAFRLNKKEIEKSYQRKSNKGSSILLGVGIATANPLFIALCISLSGSYLAQFASRYESFLNILFITLGFIIFYSLLTITVFYTKHKIQTKYVILLSKIFGIILLAYGSSFLYKFLKMLFGYG